MGCPFTSCFMSKGMKLCGVLLSPVKALFSRPFLRPLLLEKKVDHQILSLLSPAKACTLGDGLDPFEAL